MTRDGSVSLRRPTEDDHRYLADRVDAWFGRRVRHLLRRHWFRHAAATSWVATDGDGRLRGFLIGYPSGSLADTGVIHLLAVDPNHQRRGIGRALVTAFVDEMRAAGRSRIEAEHWPDERIALSFLRALGFAPEDGPGTMRLYGTPSYPDLEGGGEDRTRFVLEPGR